MQLLDRAGGSIQGTESLDLGFSPGNRTTGMLLGNRDSLPNAKSSSVLSWHAPGINQNAEQQLALC